MKKLLLLAALFVGVLGAKADDNISAKLAVEDGNQSATLTVSLNAETTQLVAFQMDVQLPEGHTYTIGEITKGASLTNGGSNSLGSTDFVIASNFVADNVLRLVAYNLGNVAINVAAGAELFHVTFTANTALEGDATAWTATFDTEKDIFVTATALEEIKLAIAGENVQNGNQVPGELSASWEMGDVNHDNSVNGIDLGLLIDAIVNESTEGIFKNEADFDGNNSINGLDLGALIDKLLGK